MGFRGSRVQIPPSRLQLETPPSLRRWRLCIVESGRVSLTTSPGNTRGASPGATGERSSRRPSNRGRRDGQRYAARAAREDAPPWRWPAEAGEIATVLRATPPGMLVGDL